MRSLTIGRLAKTAGVGVETIRFYEREGLVNEPKRTRAGYRQYPLESVRRVRFIRQAKALGFSLKEIAELLALKVDPNSSCSDVYSRATEKIQDIERRIESSANMKSVLERLASQCPGEHPTSECPILDALEKDFDARR